MPPIAKRNATLELRNGCANCFELLVADRALDAEPLAAFGSLNSAVYRKILRRRCQNACVALAEYTARLSVACRRPELSDLI